MNRRTVVAALVVVLVGAAGCDAGTDAIPALTDRGDTGNGRELVRERGCTSCHRIPGASGHEAFVGPPLDAWSRRSFIAGELSNNAENLRRWLEDPRAIRPGTAMPEVGLSESEIDDVVAFLSSLD